MAADRLLYMTSVSLIPQPATTMFVDIPHTSLHDFAPHCLGEVNIRHRPI